MHCSTIFSIALVAVVAPAVALPVDLSIRSLEDAGALVARVVTKPPSKPIEVKEKPPHAPKKRLFDSSELSGRSFEDEELFERAFEDEELYARDLVARVKVTRPTMPVEVKEKPPHAPKPKRAFEGEELSERALDEEDLWERDLEARVIPKPFKPVEVKEKPPHRPRPKRSFHDEELYERAFSNENDLYVRQMGYWFDE
ncbi:hypothetical protein C8Q72DRAFT_556917 [Fomitopsis betulina]|nr:hypothetical protein C8Q72DRAFT_556917 [Fomitopsis betulina]